MYVSDSDYKKEEGKDGCEWRACGVGGLIRGMMS